MKEKLVLKIDAEILKKAEQYAEEQNTDISEIIERILKILAEQSPHTDLPPLVKSLTGVVNLEDKEYEEEYRDFLQKKYK